MSRIIDSKWDKLKHSSSSSSSSSSSEEDDDDDEGEKEAGITRSALLENLSLCCSSSSSSAIWTGLVLHHKDIFVSHVLSKLNGTDRFFFSRANGESWGVLEYAGVDVSELRWVLYECTSISTLEWMWNHSPWGEKDRDEDVMDQAWFCREVALTNKLELLKWAREVKHCEWDEETINAVACEGNLETLKYCFSEECPYDEETSCFCATIRGRLDCLRFLFDKVEPSRKTEEEMVINAAISGHMDIMKYLVEERKIAGDAVKIRCVSTAAMNGRLDCLKYIIEDAKAPLNDDDDGREHLSFARYYERTECVNYLREKGCPEPTEEEYAEFVEDERERVAFYEREEERQSNTSSSD
ncbi:unnamed protein product [Bathycoccus prasinos]